MVMTAGYNYATGFSRSNHQELVDAIRETLGMRPLYRTEKEEPPFCEVQFGTIHHPVGLVRAHTDTDWHGREYSGDSGFRRKVDGRRVGTIFRDGARRPGSRRRS
jgi:hypothetical protein